VDFQLGQYYGTPVNRAARLRAIAHGGQTLISASTWELVKDTLPDGVSVVDQGEHRLRDLTTPEHVFELVIDGLERDFQIGTPSAGSILISTLLANCPSVPVD
jgi:class 3 adenylate cyclase